MFKSNVSPEEDYNTKEKKAPEHNGINYALPNRAWNGEKDVLQLIYNQY